MAYLWVEDGTPETWLPVELTDEVWRLSAEESTLCREEEIDWSTPRPTLLVRRSDAIDSPWMLLAGAEANIRVNGANLHSVTHVLQHMDEILLGDAETDCWRRCIFSMVEPADGMRTPPNGNGFTGPGSPPSSLDR